MSDGGFEWSIYEIFEMTIVISTLLLIGSAIIFAPKLEDIKNDAIATEIMYVTHLVADTNSNVKLNYPETEVMLNGDKLLIENKKEEVKSEKEIYGGNYRIEQISKNVYCISAGKNNCNSLTSSVKVNGGQPNSK